MSTPEFEVYWAVLGRSLALSPHETHALSAELRDHFDERLTELIEAGVERLQAARLVLDEFGEAAELAARFSDLALRRRRRRWMMRAGAGMFATTAVVLTMMLALPGGHPAAPRLSAQDSSSVSDPANAAGSSVSKTGSGAAKASAEFDLKGVPLSDAIARLAKLAEIDVVIDQSLLDTAEAAHGQRISASLALASASPKAAQQCLTTLLDSLIEVDFDVVDGVMVVAPADRLVATKVYNCRQAAGQGDPNEIVEAIQALAQLYESPGQMSPVGESLVLTQTPRIHRRVAALLKQLEEVAPASAASPASSSASLSENPATAVLVETLPGPVAVQR